jgi:tetratricopeptide (TPR) repeat protein
MDSLTFDDFRRLGRAYRETGKDSLAAVVLERALKTDTTQAALYGEVGSIYMKLKNWDRAAEMFERRFHLDTTAVGALVNFGACKMQTEEYDQASAAFERVIRINPQYPPAYIRLASCYFQQKKVPEGRQTAEKAILVVDTAKVKYRLELADAYRMIGLSGLLEKKWEEGVKSLRESLKYKEDEAQTWLLLGQGLQNMQKNKEAFEAYKRVLKLDPKNEQAKKGVETLAPIVGE